MKRKSLIFAAIFLFAVSQTAFAQNPPPPPAPAPRVSEIVLKNLENLPKQTQVSRERREQAYTKLLEAQRYIWNLRTARSQTLLATGVRNARQALIKASELDPTLAEVYTALAELTLSMPPNDLEEALILAGIAVKLDPDNFGGHRIMARLYTIKSRLNSGTLDAANAQKAITGWKEVARLDPRNAEAFAFLSELYSVTKRTPEQIDALKKWLAAAVPVPTETRFYRTMMANQGDLTPESASLKLGGVLLKSGETKEAVEILSRAVADDPDNSEAVEMLLQAIESSDKKSAVIALDALQQAVFANPENTMLVVLLAQIQNQTGQLDAAAKNLREASARLAGKNKAEAAELQAALGDLFFEKDRFDEAAKAYQDALNVRGIGETVRDEEREFAIRIFEKIINTYKKAKRPNEAKAVIDRARIVLGSRDLFADYQLISFYRETGKQQEALKAVRALRAKTPSEKELVRLEAAILTENGKVDEAVTLFKSSLKQETAGGSVAKQNLTQDTISQHVIDQLFISELYLQANRGKEAVQAVTQAEALAKNPYEKEVVKLTLATTQHNAGDFKGAEATLRGILKQSPQNAIAMNNLGYFLAERGEKLEEAVELIQRALTILPNNSSFLDSLGWAYFKLGKLDEAEKYIKDALRFNDSSSTIHEHLGDIYQKQGKSELARSAWQKALNLTSNPADVSRLNEKLNLKTAR